MKFSKLGVAVVALAIASTSLFAFTSAKKFNPRNLFYVNKSGVVVPAAATTVNTGVTFTNPTDFSTGYYTTTITAGAPTFVAHGTNAN